jgi:hypothetical protein
MSDQPFSEPGASQTDARKWAARAHFAIACAFVASVVIQVFLIGLVLFNEGDVALHRSFGFVVFLLAILVPVSAGVAGLPTRQVQLSAGLFGLTFIQMFLAALKWSGPSPVAALHPVGALLVFAVGFVVARRAWMLAVDRGTDNPTVVVPDVESSPSPTRGD